MACGAILLLAGCAQGRLGTREAFEVVDVEVTVSPAVQAPAIADEVKQDLLADAHWMNGGGRPVLMHVTLKRVSFRSSGKALATMLPFGTLIAGENVNQLRGHVDLQDRGSGAPVGGFDTMVDYETAGQSAAGIASTALSILPGPLGFAGGFAGIGVEAAASDAQEADSVSRTMAADFATAVLRGMFTDQAYGAGLARKSAASSQPASPAAGVATSQAAPSSLGATSQPAAR